VEGTGDVVWVGTPSHTGAPALDPTDAVSEQLEAALGSEDTKNLQRALDATRDYYARLYKARDHLWQSSRVSAKHNWLSCFVLLSLDHWIEGPFQQMNTRNLD
jgi:hypothetical protein